MISGLQSILGHIQSLPLAEKVAALNEVRTALHEISPFKNEPVDLVLWVPCENIIPNEYNPNHVAEREMALLEDSMTADGITQPIVTFPESDIKRVVDGEHRSRIGAKDPTRARLYGYLPVTQIEKPISERIFSTVRHNRAKGRHAVDRMGELVKGLSDLECSDALILEHLGMTAEELLRLKQNAGAAKMLRANEYAHAWGIEE